ncbi:MAG: CsgG/HfaB family protein [Elusimicrobia bacterium]|nr:CsgG/HfaB family protein [Elusimicrobiota bacterium]
MNRLIKNMPLLLSATAIFFAGCATPQVAINPRADFSGINRVAVITFSGNKGDIAADLMAQNLLAGGIDVIERQQLSAVLKEHQLTASGGFDRNTTKKIGKLLGVDALFLGSVVETTPATSYLISASQGDSLNKVTKISGGNMRSEGSVMGVPDSYLVTTAASTSLISRMVDIETGSILWSASMSYEGFDISSAISGITRAFVRSLIPIWPALLEPL